MEAEPIDKVFLKIMFFKRSWHLTKTELTGSERLWLSKFMTWLRKNHEQYLDTGESSCVEPELARNWAGPPIGTNSEPIGTDSEGKSAGWHALNQHESAQNLHQSGCSCTWLGQIWSQSEPIGVNSMLSKLNSWKPMTYIRGIVWLAPIPRQSKNDWHQFRTNPVPLPQGSVALNLHQLYTNPRQLVG